MMVIAIFAKSRFIWTCLVLIMMSSASEHDKRELDSRIVGGTVANPTRYPYYTFVLIKQRKPGATMYEEFRCGGSLIAKDVVLTAAHCFSDNQLIYDITVKVNYTSDVYTTGYEYSRKATKIILHPNYNLLPNIADIAILILGRPVNGVPLIKLNKVLSLPKNGQSLTAIGFGFIDNEENFPKNLMQVSVPKVSQKDCKDDWEILPNYVIIELAMICAATTQGGKDVCGGDSGGPLMIRGKKPNEDIQVGVVSFGPTEPCGYPDLPGVYTRVSNYFSWIQNVICQHSKYKPSSCKTSKRLPAKKPTASPTHPPTKAQSESPVSPI